MERTVIMAVAAMAAVTAAAEAPAVTDENARMAAAGLVDAQAICPGLIVDLMYARADNFTGVRLYDNLSGAWLLPAAAESLAAAQRMLEREHPGLHIKVCDAARPMSVQRRMFSAVQGTPKSRYVSNPSRGGGQHNYGVAVDVTLADSCGRELDMGTPVDHLGPEAHIGPAERQMLADGRLTQAQLDNRLLLRRVMKAAGFTTLPTEWWHFNRYSRRYARAHLRRLDF